jgi:hypothetical protein
MLKALFVVTATKSSICFFIGVIIKYGLDASYGKTISPLEGGPLTKAVYFISGLSPATEYHFAVCTGEADCSGDYTFVTAPAPDPSPQPPNLPQQIGDPAAFPFPRCESMQFTANLLHLLS